jgi:hypothetical protein
MLLQNFLAKWIHLTLEDTFHSGALKSKVKAANACKK